ncbi:MAG TPA: ribonuclease III, partial [Parachlamydiaceae bacterium]|nr:ribonuclease III [Parachlamydiaceae bacterium]
QHASKIESKINYTFKDRKLLLLAFIHRSFANENRDVKEHNERLEFLGDSVLGLIASEYLYENLPDHPEGELSYLKSRLVEAASCVSYVQKLDVESYLALGKGEKFNAGRGRDSILADLFEALIGAIYLDSGFESAKTFFTSFFKKEIEHILKTPVSNWKALLQDHCQKKYQKVPLYNVLKEEGPEHSKTFNISVIIEGQEIGRGSGSSKKEAQQAAAKSAMESIQKI